MACRCSDINLCNIDMQTLNNAQTKASNLFADVNAIQNQINILISYSEDAYTADNNEEICAAMDKLNDEIGPALSQTLAAINQKKNELAIMIACLSNEDRIHHVNEELQRLAKLRSSAQEERMK